MHKHKLTALIGAGLLVVAAGAWLIQFEGSTHALYERFPDVPKDVVRKVHKEMVKEAFAGEYKDLPDDDDSMDALFRSKAIQYM